MIALFNKFMGQLRVRMRAVNPNTDNRQQRSPAQKIMVPLKGSQRMRRFPRITEWGEGETSQHIQRIPRREWRNPLMELKGRGTIPEFTEAMRRSRTETPLWKVTERVQFLERKLRMKRDQVPLAQIRKAAAANASQIPYILGQKVRINKDNHKGKGKAERRGGMKSAAKRRRKREDFEFQLVFPVFGIVGSSCSFAYSLDSQYRGQLCLNIITQRLYAGRM